MVWTLVLSNHPTKEKEEIKSKKNNHDQHYVDNVDKLTMNTTMPPLHHLLATTFNVSQPILKRTMQEQENSLNVTATSSLSKRWSKPKNPISPLSPSSPPWHRNIGRTQLPSRNINFHNEIGTLIWGWFQTWSLNHS